MKKNQIEDMDRLQRKMLRRIVGWRRIDGEEWKDTMKQMNLRLSRVLDLHYCQSWSISFVRNQLRYVHYINNNNNKKFSSSQQGLATASGISEEP